MSSVRKSLAWSFTGRYSSQVITLLSSMVLARLLTPEQIGIFSLSAAITAMATIFRDFGVSEYIIQEKELTDEKLKGAYALAFLMAWFMAALLFLSKNAIANYYNEQGVADVISILCITFIVLPFASPGFAILNREMAFNKIFIIQFSSTIVHALTAISLAYLGFSYLSLAWAALSNIVMQTVLITLLRPKESLMIPSLKKLPYVWRFGMMFSFSRAIEVIMNNSHELIIGKQFGFYQLGMFSRAMGLINLFWINVTSAVTRVAAPSFAASYHKSSELLFRDYEKAVSMFTVIAWPFFIFLALESKNIIYILFGEQWIEAASIVSVLVISQLISSLISLAPNVLIATGHVKKRLWINMIIAPIHILGIYLFSMFDIIWVAVVWSVTWTIAVFLYYYHLSKILNYNFKNLWNNVRISLLVSLVFASAVASGFYVLNQFFQYHIVLLSLNMIVAIVSWLLSVFLFNHPVKAEIVILLKNILKYTNNR